MLDDWVCAYCKESFTLRSDWVEHLQSEHGVDEDNIVEPIDRAN